jgi:predicted nucleic acid-binding protein
LATGNVIALSHARHRNAQRPVALILGADQKVSNALPDVLEAARIKARYAIAYADCFAVATALREGAPIVTGDPQFKKVEDIVQVHRKPLALVPEPLDEESA